MIILFFNGIKFSCSNVDLTYSIINWSLNHLDIIINFDSFLLSLVNSSFQRFNVPLQMSSGFTLSTYSIFMFVLVITYFNFKHSNSSLKISQCILQTFEVSVSSTMHLDLFSVHQDNSFSDITFNKSLFLLLLILDGNLSALGLFNLLLLLLVTLTLRKLLLVHVTLRSWEAKWLSIGALERSCKCISCTWETSTFVESCIWSLIVLRLVLIVW